MLSQRKLNTYGVESPCNHLPRVGSFLANPGLSKEQLVPSCVVRASIMVDISIEIFAHFGVYLFLCWQQLYYKMNISTPQVLRFLSVIRHKSPRYTHVFSKKTQYLWRWTSLRTFTQGRLVPRQPWAIKGTTPTALHGCDLRYAQYIHWKTIFISMTLTTDIIYIVE